MPNNSFQKTARAVPFLGAVAQFRLNASLEIISFKLAASEAER